MQRSSWGTLIPKSGATTATFADEVTALEQAGVDMARNLHGEAGQGLADDACDLLDAAGPD